ncbi:MAG: hypothetical protein P8Y80_16550 [Acidobacteriota bacterium]
MSASATNSKGFYGWNNLVVTSLVGIVGAFYMVSFGYFLPELLDEFGWANMDASFAAIFIFTISFGSSSLDMDCSLVWQRDLEVCWQGPQ